MPYLAAVSSAAPLGGQGLGPLLVEVVVPGQPGLGVGGVLGDVAHLGNLAAADDADFQNLIHDCVPSFI